MGSRVENVSLSDREIACLQWVSHGLNYQEIAEKLGLSEQSAHYYITVICKKLDANSISHATAKAIRASIIA